MRILRSVRIFTNRNYHFTDTPPRFSLLPFLPKLKKRLRPCVIRNSDFGEMRIYASGGRFIGILYTHVRKLRRCIVLRPKYDGAYSRGISNNSGAEDSKRYRRALGAPRIYFESRLYTGVIRHYKYWGIFK